MQVRIRSSAIAALVAMMVIGCGDDETVDPGGAGGAPDLGTPRVDLLIDGAEIPGANGMFFDPQDRLYVASVNSKRLFVLDPDTGETLETLGNEKGVSSPDDVTIAADGTVYFTNIVHGTVGSISPSGEALELASLGQGVNSITLSDDGRLFVGLDFLGDGLYELDPAGAAEPRQVIATPGWLNGMDFGPDGFIYAPQWSQAKVVRVDPDTGTITPVSSEFDSLAAAVKFDSTGQLHALEHVPAHAVQLDAATGARTILASYARAGDNLAFDSNDRLFISSTEDGAVHEVMDDGSLRQIKQGGMVAPTGIVVEDRAGVEAVTVMASNLNTYDGETGDELEHRTLGFYFGEQQSKGGGAAIRVDGQSLLVADWTPGHGVEVWDLQTGRVTESYTAGFAFDVIRFRGEIVVSLHFTNAVAVVGAGEPTPLVENIQAPTGLAATDDDLFVASFGTGEILQIVDAGQPVDPPRAVATGIDGPEGLALLPSGRLVVVEAGTGNVIAVEIASGAKTTLATGISPAFTLLENVPAWGINGIGVAPSGNVYVTSPGDGKVHRITFE
jgi:sugar lactone lactonase YvrE